MALTADATFTIDMAATAAFHAAGEHTMTDLTPVDDETLRGAEWESERHDREGLYHEIKRKLIARGVPAHEIKFIHEADSHSKKSKLFADMNKGRVRVLLGSTSKMGVAMNAQERMIALHHMDAPWRPRDVEQREGRLIRQGNIFGEVFVLQYVTEGSMDCYIWNIIESKARFIHQIMSGEVTQRTAEDIGDMVLTAGQIKAVASGNPKVMERVEHEIKLTKLERLRAAYYNNRSAMRHQVSYLPNQIADAQAEVEWHRQAHDKLTPPPEGEYLIRLKTGYQAECLTPFDKRQDAGRILRHLGDLALDAVRRAPAGSVVREEVGEYRGFKVFIHATNPALSFINSLFNQHVEIQLRAERDSRPYVASITGTDHGITQSIDYQLRQIDDLLAQAVRQKERLEKRLADLQAEIDKPWKHLPEYKRLRRKYERLGLELKGEGVAVETGVTFGNLVEGEAGDTVEECEEAVEASGTPASPYITEAEVRNPLTGLETDPIIVMENERPGSSVETWSAVEPPPLQQLNSATGPTASGNPVDEEPDVRGGTGIEKSSGTPQQTGLFAELLATKAGCRKRQKKRTVPNSQLGFGWDQDPRQLHLIKPFIRVSGRDFCEVNQPALKSAQAVGLRPANLAPKGAR